MNEDALFKLVKEKLGVVIPEFQHIITVRLLSKPTFKFLHDIILEIVETTGYGEGIYSELESNFDNYNNKQSKMLFLDKMITLVNISKVSSILLLYYYHVTDISYFISITPSLSIGTRY